MRIWFKEMQGGHILAEVTYEDYQQDTRTHKVFAGLEYACLQLDLPVPIWLASTVKEFKLHSKARFTGDCFIEEIPFDYLEIEVLEEDW